MSPDRLARRARETAQLIEAYASSGTLPGLPEGHFIDGTCIGADRSKQMMSLDPGTGKAFASFAAGGADDIDCAVAAATGGLRVWRQARPGQRCQLLNRVAALIEKQAPLLAVVEAIDSGKTLAEAEAEVTSAARLFEYYAGAADKLEGRSIPLGPNHSAWTVREPVGITAHIIPWNYPTSTFARSVAPALASGCSVIVKPASTTPFTALLLAALMGEAGLPPGVINVVTGRGSDAGAALASHPGVAHISFTGSTSTGMDVMRAAASNAVPLTLELGGKSPIVALADCNLEAAAAGALSAIFCNAGQVCSAGSRLVVQRAIHDALVSRIVEGARVLSLGHGLRNPQMGAINNPSLLARIENHVTQARARGASILCGGRATHDPETGLGWFFEPTVVDAPDSKDPLVQQEIFGPVLTVQVADDEDEALALANDTEFGLMAGIYTRDISRALRLARDLDSGQVTINEYWAGGVEVPFGGNRRSGFGRAKGLEGLDAYTHTKSVIVRI